MKNLAFAALAALSLGACATNGNGNAGATARTAAGAQYCSHGRLEAVGQRLNCNWTASMEAACAGTAEFSTVDGSRYHHPRTVNCPNGQRVLELAPKA